MAGLCVCAYPALWRIVAGVLVAVSRASLPALLVAGVWGALPVPLFAVPLFAWFRMLGAFALLPAVVAWLIRRSFLVEVEVRDNALVLERQGLRIEVPSTAIGTIRPWRLPLPGAGFSLQLRSGRRFAYGLQVADPRRLLAALAEIGGVERARAAMHHPSVVYAQAKTSVGRWRWYHVLAKFVLFGLAPAAVMFNLDQHVTYGGLLGQYYLQGLGPYLKTFSIYWGLVTVYLILYASVWRGLAEGAAFLAAWVAPTRAATVRRLGEIVCRVLFYVGVPVIVVVPFLQ